ncbi:hypothetical protein COY65_00980 [Candidatus Jorgensenbacteria bacterium CG_4_10_14_0_8_um_filter_39_13]|uniref:Uncharacterized protein n=2 Tax=Candidatus Joergenseniibacteriota TaxID=1752739 RepID=A0A2M7RHV2_9BACT|nr:MAG: hypothetical protein COV54_00350 [Candidatus Jorgensenbacteria bacterium CG11_big_fil_rev_8_21_14_0_20_38_23]PIV13215.1 MAG: hypothetical protein COS46_01590 [Candidatus Jorgensenbacteria bacterium CG03_land_8_20_14_0_80_38_39]PIY96325.1 MAG: hypothetical protein COY65_00980 [Candidatus Jorgensenbacteria bacterium CG_4_10_14_0_8_um_filter_39_13]PJA94927.1 MAG: hypothetical protein CO130_01800 [Candidatus Jorgensenbacteria bacterium CG_4_9_14_3_um_filter_38_10]
MKIKKLNRDIYFFIIIFLLMAAIFVFLYFKMNVLSDQLQQIQQSQLSQSIPKNIVDQNLTPPAYLETTSSISVVTTPPSPLPSTSSEQGEGLVIPVSLVFVASSSPALEPQTSLTITVEKAIKKENQIIFQINVFAKEAESYSAADLSSFFHLFDLDSGESISPAEIKGSFQTLPPKSSRTGSVIFNLLFNQNKIILQTGDENQSNFYEFDFLKKTYKEIVVG